MSVCLRFQVFCKKKQVINISSKYEFYATLGMWQIKWMTVFNGVIKSVNKNISCIYSKYLQGKRGLKIMRTLWYTLWHIIFRVNWCRMLNVLNQKKIKLNYSLNNIIIMHFYINWVCQNIYFLFFPFFFCNFPNFVFG